MPPHASITNGATHSTSIDHRKSFALNAKISQARRQRQQRQMQYNEQQHA